MYYPVVAYAVGLLVAVEEEREDEGPRSVGVLLGDIRALLKENHREILARNDGFREFKRFESLRRRKKKFFI